MNNTSHYKYTSISIAWIWLGLFCLLPLLSLAFISFMQPSAYRLFSFHFTFAHYVSLIDPAFFQVLWRSFVTAFLSSAGCLLVGYPFALAMACKPKRTRVSMLIALMIPFWTSSLVRTYAVMTLIRANGIINTLLIHLHIIQQPLSLLYTPAAVYIGLIYTLLPFMILPLYTNLDKFDWKLWHAAQDLGANTFYCFYRVLLPHSVPGILSGVLLTLFPAMTLFFIPAILGGARSLLLGNLISNQVLLFNNWPQAAAISITMIVLMLILITALQRAHSSYPGRQ